MWVKYKNKIVNLDEVLSIIIDEKTEDYYLDKKYKAVIYFETKNVGTFFLFDNVEEAHKVFDAIQVFLGSSEDNLLEV